jgi:uncharacterized DUF497 family protein
MVSKVRISRLEFTEGSKRHIIGKRGVTETEIRQAFLDPYRSTGIARGSRRAILGQAEGGSYLTVIGFIEEDTFWVVTSRVMNDNEKKQYKERKRRRYG